MGCQCARWLRYKQKLTQSELVDIPLSQNVRIKSISSPTTIDSITHLDLYIPIYIALQSYRSLTAGEISFEKNDEMKLISDSNQSQLEVQHLRSGAIGFVSIYHVQLDANSPLRLAIDNRGVANQCLEKYDEVGAFMIRANRSCPTDFVLSISQKNQSHNTHQWHYLITLDSRTHMFYFRNETEIQNLRFQTLHNIVENHDVRKHIPLRKVIPKSIDFDEELWRIPFHQLKVVEHVGKGAYGEVFRGQWRKGSDTRTVALKKLRTNRLPDAFTHEIDVMKALTNLNIVSLYGISTDECTREIYLVTEFMEDGDLGALLKKSATLPDYATIINYATQIAAGMAYLESRNYVHRDLACRNILVSGNGRILRIADFGLAVFLNKSDERASHQEKMDKIPVRWAAPEILQNGFTDSIKSDVWSFGIVLIEIWLKGEYPYGKKASLFIKDEVLRGLVHEKPPACPTAFYKEFIVPCLQYQPNDRPRFRKLRNILETMKKNGL